MLESQQEKNNIESMPAQEKIELIRGRAKDYAIRVRDAVNKTLPGLKATQGKTADSIYEAFELRIQLYFASPSGAMNGGDRLAHLPQLGVGKINESQYQQLARSAAALAASFMKEAGFDDRAKLTYSDLGRMVAPDYTN